MKILQVISSMDPIGGGVSEAVRQLSEAAIAQGCAVEAATLDAPGCKFLAESAFPIHALGPGKTHFAYSARMTDWLAQHAGRFDAIVVNGLWQYHGFAARRAARAAGIPYFVYPHGMLDSYFKRAHPVKHLKKWLFWPWCDYRVLRDAAGVCFTTEEELLSARGSFGLYSAKEVVVNLGIAAPPAGRSRQESAFYARWPELRGKKLVLFLGRIHPKKGCDLAIRAFAEVFSHDAEWQLVLAGPDQMGWQANLESLLPDLQMEGRCTFTGMISGDQKWGALSAADCFFLPSHQENFGVVVAEALACGTAVLISDKVNIWREVEAGGCGLVAPDTLAGTISLLRRWKQMDSAERQRTREKTVPCFEHHFEISQAAARLIQTLRATLARGVAEMYANV
jgi:glycosyltransferase involved in cell wall biosynthesis